MYACMHTLRLCLSSTEGTEVIYIPRLNVIRASKPPRSHRLIGLPCRRHCGSVAVALFAPICVPCKSLARLPSSCIPKETRVDSRNHHVTASCRRLPARLYESRVESEAIPHSQARFREETCLKCYQICACLSQGMAESQGG